MNTAPPASDALDGKPEAEEDDGGDGVSGEESGSSRESEGGKKGAAETLWELSPMASSRR